MAALTIAGCGERDSASHDDHTHDGIEADHLHEAPDDDHGHDHDAVDDDHDHDADAEDDDHGHDHDAVDDDHDHDADAEDDDHGHDHDADDDDHDHDHDADVEDDHDHDADSEGAALIEGDDDWEHLIGLETAEAHIRPLQVHLQVPGAIIPQPDAHAIVSPFIEANVDTVLVTVGDRVKRGEVLACLTSPEIGVMRAEYDRATAELAIRERVYKRRKGLFEDNVISRSAYDDAELDIQTARVAHTYALEMLRAIGLTERDLSTDSSHAGGTTGSSIPLRAPIPGIIAARNAHIGQKVDSGSELFEIIDPATVWVEGSIFEKDLTSVAKGQRVTVRVSAFDETFEGKIFHIGSILDEDTKTVTMYAAIPNRRELLKSGMYAAAEIALGEGHDTLVVPREAVLNDEHLRIVFVREEVGYHRHVVETGLESGGFIEISDGLSPGDIVVTTGNYQLKSRLAMSTIDPHAGHNH